MIEYKQNAIGYAKNMISEKKTIFDKYSLTEARYIEDYNEFSYTFTKEISGYQVNDGIIISLDASGNLSSFVATQQGLYDCLQDIKIDKNLVNNFISKTMKSDYSEYTNYTIDEEFINFIDNKYVLQIGITVEHSNGLFSSEVLYYDLTT